MLFGIAYGQGGYLKPNNSYGLRLNRVAPDSVLHIPDLTDTLSLSSTQTWPQIRVVGDSIWWYKNKWRNLSDGRNIYNSSGALTSDRLINGLYGGVYNGIQFGNLGYYGVGRISGGTFTSINSTSGNAGTSYLNRATISGRGSDAKFDTTKTLFGYFNPDLPSGYVSSVGIYQDSLVMRSAWNRIYGFTETSDIWDMYGSVTHYAPMEAAAGFTASGGSGVFISEPNINGQINIASTGITTPTPPVDGNSVNQYFKGDKIIYQFNDAGTIRYKYLDMSGTGVTWVHTLVAP